MKKPCNSTDIKKNLFFYAKDKTLIELNFPLISKLYFRVFSFHHLLKLLNRILLWYFDYSKRRFAGKSFGIRRTGNIFKIKRNAKQKFIIRFVQTSRQHRQVIHAKRPPSLVQVVQEVLLREKKFFSLVFLIF